MKRDLHMHSTASDGALAPAQLVCFCAEACGVGMMALTDHDTVAGVSEAKEAAESFGIIFIPGIEFSCTYARLSIHVVGLGVNHEDTRLIALTDEVCTKRDNRAKQISEKLEALGYPGMLEKALSYSPRGENISRLHFAKALMTEGIVKNENQAFERFLGTGAPANVPAPWGTVPEAVQNIHAAGGVAILAHPGRYRFKNDRELDVLVKEFTEAGGEGIEVVSGSQSPAFTEKAAVLARRYGLAASFGSDFHNLESTSRPGPGDLVLLPSHLTSVLSLLGV